MEEDIKILEHLKNDFIKLINKKDEYVIERDKREKEVQAIEKLINKYKEQEKHIKALDSVVIEHIEKSKEQEKMIELMLIDLSKIAFYKDDIIDYCEVKKQECEETADVECKNCLLEYYKKKAREENEIN